VGEGARGRESFRWLTVKVEGRKNPYRMILL
jgi:hypothetical protein